MNGYVQGFVGFLILIVAFLSGYYHGEKAGKLDASIASIKALD